MPPRPPRRTRAQGGLGFHEVGGFLNLHGKPHVIFHDPNTGCSGVDVYAVPNTFLFDGAAQDLGEAYAEQVIAVAQPRGGRVKDTLPRGAAPLSYA